MHTAGYRVGPGCRVIAEIGSNHNGDLDLALGMIEEAAASGADTVKFQFYRADKLYPAHIKVADYLVGKGGVTKDTKVTELLARSEVKDDWLPELMAKGKACGVDCLFSVFDVESLDVLLTAGVQELKIASSEITHYPLLRAVAQTGLPVILSTGMSTLGTIEKALEALGNSPVTLLHCTAAYPTPPEEANISAIKTLANCFGLPVGLSDHTLGTTAAVLAVGMGAVMLEKHFTMDKSLPGPDQSFAADPTDLRSLVNDVRTAEKMLGDGVKAVTGKEREITKYTPGLFASRDVNAGEQLSWDNVKVLRRGGEGISTTHEDVVLGRRAKVDISAEWPITWDVI